MSTKRFVSIVCLIGILCLAGILWQRWSQGKRVDTVMRDTVIVVDTYVYKSPYAIDSVRTRYVTRYLRLTKHDTIKVEDCIFGTEGDTPSFVLSDDSDSASVEIPITQKCYKSETYRAYVSGYEVSLDSIFVFGRTRTITEREHKPPNKWHIGIMGGLGYGMKSKQVEPYIGVGITYSLIGF